MTIKICIVLSWEPGDEDKAYSSDPSWATSLGRLPADILSKLRLYMPLAIVGKLY